MGLALLQLCSDKLSSATPSLKANFEVDRGFSGLDVLMQISSQVQAWSLAPSA